MIFMGTSHFMTFITNCLQRTTVALYYKLQEAPVSPAPGGTFSSPSWMKGSEKVSELFNSSAKGGGTAALGNCSPFRASYIGTGTFPRERG